MLKHLKTLYVLSDPHFCNREKTRIGFIRKKVKRKQVAQNFTRINTVHFNLNFSTKFLPPKLVTLAFFQLIEIYAETTLLNSEKITAQQIPRKDNFQKPVKQKIRFLLYNSDIFA